MYIEHGKSLRIYPTQDSSHHQDDMTLLRPGNPKLNLYLPVASCVGCDPIHIYIYIHFYIYVYIYYIHGQHAP